jgi:hypothetical protein
LDVNNYRAALMKIQQDRASADDARVVAESAHIKSVRAALDRLGQSDVVFVSPATDGLTMPDGIHWLAAAAQEASQNRQRVSVLVGQENVAVFNVLSLPTHGMLSQKLLNQVRASLLMQDGGVPGPMLVMYPLIPRSVYQAKRSSTALAATGALAAIGALGSFDTAENSSDSEEDCEMADEQLLEVLTKAATTMSKWDRDTSLARDRFQIDSVLGQHDLAHVCPKVVTVSFKPDTSGSRASEKGLLLTKPPARLCWEVPRCTRQLS